MVIVMIAFLHSSNTNSPQFITEASFEIHKYLISLQWILPYDILPSKQAGIKQNSPQFS